MLKLVGNDKDFAAAIIGHEIAHITLEHGETRQSRSRVLSFIGILAGIAINVLIEEHTGIQQDIVGGFLANLSTNLVANSFGRVEEREADEAGLKYASKAGYDPKGSVRLWQKLIAFGITEGGVFATHPGSQDRLESLKVIIAGLPPRKPEPVIVASTPLEHEPVGDTFPRVSAALLARYDYQVRRRTTTGHYGPT